MKIRYNGTETALPDGLVLADFLQQNGYRPEIIAVELNYSIIPKDSYASTLLKEGDELEVVSFMGGG